MNSHHNSHSYKSGYGRGDRSSYGNSRGGGHAYRGSSNSYGHHGRPGGPNNHHHTGGNNYTGPHSGGS